MKYHICIGCLAKIPVTKKGWELSPHIQTVCDYCFFDVSKIITKVKGKKRFVLLKQYQTKHMMLRENNAGKFAASPYEWENKKGVIE